VDGYRMTLRTEKNVYQEINSGNDNINDTTTNSDVYISLICRVFGQPFAQRFALCYQCIICLSVLSILPVCL